MEKTINLIYIYILMDTTEIIILVLILITFILLVRLIQMKPQNRQPYYYTQQKSQRQVQTQAQRQVQTQVQQQAQHKESPDRDGRRCQGTESHCRLSLLKHRIPPQ